MGKLKHTQKVIERTDLIVDKHWIEYTYAFYVFNAHKIKSA